MWNNAHQFGHGLPNDYTRDHSQGALHHWAELEHACETQLDAWYEHWKVVLSCTWLLCIYRNSLSISYGRLYSMLSSLWNNTMCCVLPIKLSARLASAIIVLATSLQGPMVVTSGRLTSHVRLTASHTGWPMFLGPFFSTYICIFFYISINFFMVPLVLNCTVTSCTHYNMKTYKLNWSTISKKSTLIHMCGKSRMTICVLG